MTESCNICRHQGPRLVAEEAWVRSNVRAFAQERFRVWRCGGCKSIHAHDEVDLTPYYAKYPFHNLPADWRLRVCYDNQLRRLRRAGLLPQHTLLDFGCGDGSFVRYLRERGYTAYGFDAYSEGWNDPNALQHSYDCVFAQDLLEHVASPHDLLDTFERLTVPGGLIAIGTPNASALSLSDPEPTIHALHLPYHRHIFSAEALIAVGNQRSWTLSEYYGSEYANTKIPFINSAFTFYYLGLLDNSIDALFEPPQLSPLVRRLPMTLFLGLCGSLLAKDTDVMALFRTATAPMEFRSPADAAA